MNTAADLLLEAIAAHPNAVTTSAELAALMLAAGSLLSVVGKRWHFKASPALLERVQGVVMDELNDIVTEGRA